MRDKRNLNKIMKTFHSKKDTQIVFIGMSYLGSVQKKMFLSSYGLQYYEYTKTIGTTGGIEVQEWLNHHNVDNICIVSDQEDMRPLEYYRIRSSALFLNHKIKKMLTQPYTNKMAEQNRKSRRKQF